MYLLSSEMEYALLAALDLAENYSPDATVKARDIAERTGAPEKYLGQILRKLRTQMLVKSEKGPNGGYRLMRQPDMISVAEVIAAVEEQGDGRRRRDRPESGYAEALRWLTRELDEAKRKLLSNISLEDFLQRTET